MSKDQTVGAAILVLCVIVAASYIVALFLYPVAIQPWLNLGSHAEVQFWLIAVPVLVGFIGILAIGAWIGYTMATTPPPKPIEELESPAEETKSATDQ
ncbi:MAG: transcriptional regulator [Candidatus Bathyarchaeota archaeon]|nr:transcriptional regulator [Candidatus Bathyarchaeota archaeon]